MNLFFTVSGTNQIFSAFGTVIFVSSGSLMNRLVNALEINGVSHLRQCGYEWLYDLCPISFFSVFSLVMISLFTSRTLLHFRSVTSSVNSPYSLTGTNIRFLASSLGKICATASKSSMPNPGAICTMPVPSSVLTNSAGMILKS